MMSGKNNYSLSFDKIIPHYLCERPPDWDAYFGRSAPLEVEIGFGLGEYLLRSAQSRPEHDFIGIELDWQRIKKALKRIAACRKNSGGDNIRILKVDARVALLRLFRPESVSSFFCLFPCPWPKEAHVKHRLFTRSFFQLLNSRLKPSGRVHIVTDFEDYFSWMQDQADGTGFHVQSRAIAPRFDTKFEKKWREEGQETFFELELMKQQHVAVPLEEDIPLQVHFVPAFNPERFFFQNLVGSPSVIMKDFLYDPVRKKGMAHLVVAEEDITQHLWVVVICGPRGWCVAAAAGQTVLPTPGVAMAMKRMADAVWQSADKAG